MMFDKPIRFVKDCSSQPENIRVFLKKQGFSTALIAKVKMGGCYINNTLVHMRATVNPSDVVEVMLPIEESKGIDPIDLPLDIVYEDEWMIAVNKPINMPVHPSLGNSLPTVANLLASYFNSPFVFRAVNRLDRDTSGIVLIAKNQLSAAILSRSIKSGKIAKEYLAIVEGTPTQISGAVDAPIERETPDGMRRIVREDGKSCLTQYELIKSFDNGNSLLKVIPITGRTHQIRVHMKHIGHPLVNDFLYGERAEGKTYSLHCSSLTLPHPISGELIKITAPVPKGFYEQ